MISSSDSSCSVMLLSAGATWIRGASVLGFYRRRHLLCEARSAAPKAGIVLKHGISFQKEPMPCRRMPILMQPSYAYIRHMYIYIYIYIYMYIYDLFLDVFSTGKSNYY